MMDGIISKVLLDAKVTPGEKGFYYLKDILVFFLENKDKHISNGFSDACHFVADKNRANEKSVYARVRNSMIKSHNALRESGKCNNDIVSHIIDKPYISPKEYIAVLLLAVEHCEA